MLFYLNNKKWKCELCDNQAYLASKLCKNHLDDPIIKSIQKKINKHKWSRSRKLLSVVETYKMLVQQDFKCKRTWIPLCCNIYSLSDIPYNYMSIDRVDNDKWYTMDNIEIVCYMYNTMKNRFSYEEVLKVAKWIIENAE